MHRGGWVDAGEEAQKQRGDSAAVEGSLTLAEDAEVDKVTDEEAEAAGAVGAGGGVAVVVVAAEAVDDEDDDAVADAVAIAAAVVVVGGDVWAVEPVVVVAPAGADADVDAAEAAVVRMAAIAVVVVFAATAGIAPVAAADRRHKERCMWTEWFVQKQAEGCFAADWGWGTEWRRKLAVE